MKTNKSPHGTHRCQPLFSEEDCDLNAKPWRKDRYGYARTNFGPRPAPRIVKFAHHLVCERIFGRRPDWSKREVCDHINRDRLDNRRENLRIISVADNNRNGLRKCRDGISWTTRHSSGKWLAIFALRKEKHYVGLFETRGEAHAASKARRDELIEAMQPFQALAPAQAEGGQAK